jgi:phosphatidylserine/phosphatidylglycerophosphate/cardiolipin synthase-like enzyme
MGKWMRLSVIRLLLAMSWFFIIAHTTTSIASTACGYQVCFTPGANCTQLIVKTLNMAKKTIEVQAYSFTSVPIASALIDATKRGIKVRVLLDKSQFHANRYSSAKFLINYHIPVWIDFKPAIAHNKVMIIDQSQVITGSFNFTRAAQVRNAENVLIINDPAIAKLYYDNWLKRQALSRAVAINEIDTANSI